MSHNADPHTAAKNHRPAIIGIALALLVAVIAFLVFQPGLDEQNQGIAMTPPPAGTVSEPTTSAQNPASDDGNPIPIPAERPVGGPISEPSPIPRN